jgi:hypothetical protein
MECFGAIGSLFLPNGLQWGFNWYWIAAGRSGQAHQK